MNRGLTGELVSISTVGENVQAFLPRPLPPTPPLVIDVALRDAIDRALIALGRLDSVSTRLPDASLFLYTYVRKEAVLSSQIEGTQSSLSDLLLFEIEGAPGVPLDDVREVSNHVSALDHGLARLREGFPLSNRLLREVHAVLLSRGRGSGKQPGEFRTSQNWIGGTRPGNAIYVPPPPERIGECMGALEKFLHDEPERTSVLVKAALTHVQFEIIHPFLDGNGRLGRLLITLLLCTEQLLHEPLLYLSLYFKRHRQEYYDHLQRVRVEGDWEGWLSFFVEGVREMAELAVLTAQRLEGMVKGDQERIQGLGRKAGSALRVHAVLQRHPVQTISRAAERSGLSVPTVTAVMKTLRSKPLAIVDELTGKRRNQVFVYRQYIDVLNEGTELA